MFPQIKTAYLVTTLHWVCLLRTCNFRICNDVHDCTMSRIHVHVHVVVHHLTTPISSLTTPTSLPDHCQVVNAPKKSHKARLISQADKLYNLRDLMQSTPEGWSEARVQEYFEWAGRVVRGMLGASPELEAGLEEVLKTRGVSLYTSPPEVDSDTHSDSPPV